MNHPPSHDMYGFASEEDLSLFAVSAWHLGGVEADHAVAIRFAYQVPDGQGNQDTFDTPYFALNPDRTREFAHQLIKAADQVDKMRKDLAH
ncbi:hypothetical protein [Paraburkholderia sp. J11-2]|uniref:hypothetical protein n=1 Tax=Paraburkholderia sp. J11-2 TaxID=2805431 RepID=UPI002AB7257F|nr:hypothetical protein [Paraburkholderia sp. J11-2]